MNLMKHKRLFFSISLMFIIPSLIGLIVFGLKPNIDFTGGSLLEISLQPANEQTPEIVRQELGSIYDIESIQPSTADSFIIRGETIDYERKQQAVAKLQTRFNQVNEIRFETVGPVLGKELVVKTITAVLIVASLIVLYVWHQFKDVKFGVCAILAMFHDSVILMGIFSFLGYWWGVEVDVLFVTALLTTLSFSIHDTIVIYDRIRELQKEQPSLKLAQVANFAVLETLARSINNSVTIILMLAALVLMGGDTIRWFSVALLIGAIAGTYSSTFTAVPLLILWEEKFERS